MGSTGRLGRHVLTAVSTTVLAGALLLGATGVAQAAPPSVTILPATNVGETTVTLNGTVNPEGTDAKYHFVVYDTESGDKESCESEMGDFGLEIGTKGEELQRDAGSGKKAVTVSANITGLDPGTAYCYTVVADRDELETNENGELTLNSLGQYEEVYPPEEEVESSRADFTTVGKPPPPPTAPSVTLRGATQVNLTNAVIGDNVNPNDSETTYQFEYGKTAGQYTHKIPASPEGIGGGTQPIFCWNEITNLEPGTTYHFRVVATNATGTTYGPDQEFTTAGATITLRGATELSPTHAVIGDNVNPAGYETSYEFEYGKEAGKYTNKTPASPEGIGSGTQAIFCWNEVEKLEPDTTYHFRVVLTDSYGTTYGPDQEFTTGPIITLRGATEVGTTHADIGDNVDPNGFETSYQFEYGKTTKYGSKTPSSPEGIGSGTLPIFCWNEIEKLEPGTTYHFRVALTYDGITTYGPDQEFTTLAATITQRAPTEVSTTHAVIDDNVDPNGYETSYYFEYGKTTQYGSKIPTTPEGIGAGTQPIDCWNEIEHLEPGTTYHFRIVAITGPATTYGPAQELTTLGATITLRGATEVNPTHADIGDNVDPNGYETSYQFEYGKTTKYGSKTPSSPEGIGAGTQPIFCWNEIEKLEPGTTYHFRVVLTDAGNTTYGPDQEFTTPGEAPKNTAPPAVSPTAPVQGVPETATTGSWTGSPTSYAYQWERCNSSGTECASIFMGATSSTYTPVEADVEHTLVVKVTATNSAGSNSAVSSATSEVAGSPTYASSFGSLGSGSGQLHEPRSLALNGKGESFVADEENNRIDVFNETGTFVKAFGFGVSNGEAKLETCTSSCKAGLAGSSTGELKAPKGVAIDSKGDIWVADTGNNRIEEFNEKGESPKVFGSSGTAGGQFDEPKGIAIDSHGNVWIADTENFRIQELNEKGEFAKTFGFGVGSEKSGSESEKFEVCTKSCKAGIPGTGVGQFVAPRALAVAPNGSVWIADTWNSRLEEFNEKGESPKVIGSAGAGNGQFKEPKGIAIDSHGNVWVSDSENDRVQELNEKGEFITMFGFGVSNGESKFENCTSSCKAGLAGSGSGQFKEPWGIQVDSHGNVYVSDSENDRVEKFVPKG